MLPEPPVCYRAITARDRRFDGLIFTAVKTTGIFCRPICPARTPLAKNVTFFSTAAAAIAAGYRPCLRCRPEVSPAAPAWRGTAPTVERALRLIEEGALDDQGVDRLAARLGVSDRHLRRLFLDHLGATPVAVAQTRRALFAKRLITDSALSFTEIAGAAGFSSLRRFHQAMRQLYGFSPTELRRRESAQPAGAMEFVLPYRPPYHWTAIIGFLGPRAITTCETITPESYRREEPEFSLEVHHDEAAQALRARIATNDTRLLRGIVDRLRRFWDLAADGATIADDLERSPLLHPMVKRYRGIRVPGCWDPFELMIRAILGQQVTVKGATTLMNRLVEQFGRPSASVLADARVEQIGLPGKRADTIRAVGRAVADGVLPLDGSIPPTEAIERMVALPGLGPWTANYVAMRALGAPDAFPASDLGLLKAAGANSARELERTAEAWRPWRSYAAFYLWHHGGQI